MILFSLISSKVLNSIVLLGWAQRLIDERDKNAKSTATVVDSQVNFFFNVIFHSGLHLAICNPCLMVITLDEDNIFNIIYCVCKL